MQVTISGDIGSGKSTVGVFLANKLNAELIDCGQLYRAYASKRDMSVLDLNKSGDNSIDKQIDNDIIRMGKEGLSRVYISRTAWHFIPDAVHVYMSVNPAIAAERIFKRKSVAEEHTTLESILEYNKERVSEEDTRYEKMYGITRRQQLSESDLLVCIGNASADEVCNAVYQTVDKGRVLCFDPRVAVPTQVLHDTNPKTVENYKQCISGDIVYMGVRMQFVNGIPYILDGHHRIAAACSKGVKFVYTDNFDVLDKPECMLSSSDYYDWEDYVKGDLSQVTGITANTCNGISDAINKMCGN